MKTYCDIQDNVFMLSCSVHMLTHGCWKLINETENPELKDLASRLPNTVLHSRADSTAKNTSVPLKDGRDGALAHQLQPIKNIDMNFIRCIINCCP